MPDINDGRCKSCKWWKEVIPDYFWEGDCESESAASKTALDLRTKGDFGCIFYEFKYKAEVKK
jgi:hypothetical protein